MAKLPNAERAIVLIEKIRDYRLNPTRDDGQQTAEVFRLPFGFHIHLFMHNRFIIT